MLGNCSGECVFDRDNYDGNVAGFKMVEYLNRASTRKQRTTGYHAARGFVAERTRFTLDSNSHESKLAGRLR